MTREEWSGGRAAAALFTALGLAACGHDQVRPQAALTPIEVAIPVATGCVPANIAAAPEYPDTDAAIRAAPDAASRYQLLYAGRKVRSARLNELEPVVAGCPKVLVK